MRFALVLAGCAAMVACVSPAPEPTPAPKPTSAPELTEAQNERVEFVGIYMTGDTPGQKYSLIAPIEAVACSGSPRRPDAKAIDILMRKAVASGGEAVVGVSCKAVSLNDCSTAGACTGMAVRWKN